MSLIVVAYPSLASADFEWIQEYRKRNDPRYFQLIDPHFIPHIGIGNSDDPLIAKRKVDALNARGVQIAGDRCARYPRV